MGELSLKVEEATSCVNLGEADIKPGSQLWSLSTEYGGQKWEKVSDKFEMHRLWGSRGGNWKMGDRN